MIYETLINQFSDVLRFFLNRNLALTKKEMVLLAKENGEMLRNLIGNILDYSKIDAGKMELDVQVYNLNQQINKIIKMNSELEQKKSKFF
jgi:signal transduction histidine kinase